MIDASEFTKIKEDKIASLNREHPNGFDHEWSVFLRFCGTRQFRTVLDKDGRCIDLAEHNDCNIRNIRNKGK
jgi:hypothetical protein